MPDFTDYYCVFPSILTDGCTLECFSDCEYDFLIANHLIKDAENFFKAVFNHLRVLKVGVYIIYAVPDKRFTFDNPRDLTTYEHLLDEFNNGACSIRFDHYLECNKTVEKLTEKKLLKRCAEFLEREENIHWHVSIMETFLDHIQQAIAGKLLMQS